MKSKLIVLLLACASLLALGVTGCSKESKKAGHLKRAQAYFDSGDYDRAEIEYKNVLRYDQTNHAAIRNLGVMCFDQGRPLQAYALLNQARQDNPEDFEVRLRLATLYLASGNATNARQEALLLVARQPTNALVLLLLADSSATNDLSDTEQRFANLKSTGGDSSALHLANGVVKIRRGDTAGAEVEIRQALALDPKSSPAHAALGTLCLLRKDLTNALAALKAAADNAPPRSAHRVRYAELQMAMGQVAAARAELEAVTKQTPDYLPALLKLAQIALAERRFADSEGMLVSAQRRDPTQLEVIILLAQLNLARNEPAKAITELERGLKIYSKAPQPQLHLQLAVAHLMQNDLPAAIKQLNTALALQSNFPEATMLLAELNIRRRDPTSAINALTRLVSQRPQLVRAQMLLATAYRARAASPTSLDLDAALRIYQDLGRSYPTNAELAHASGIVLWLQKKPAEARKSFERILSFDPDNLGALEQLIEIDLIDQNFAAAKNRAQQQMARTPKLAAPQALLARVHFAETNLPAAEAALQQAIAIQPDFRPAHALLARVYVAQNKHLDAVRKLEEMTTRNTNDVVSLQQLAELQSAAKNYPAARDAYEKILVVSPQFTPALNNLAWLYSEHLKEPKRAYELATRGFELAPTNAYTADTFGWVLYRNRDFPRALVHIQTAATAYPSQPEIQYHLGMTHYMLGEEAPAKVALQNAVQLARDGDWLPDARSHLRVLELDAQSADAATIAELKTLLNRTPNDPMLLLRLAAIAERDRAWSEAEAYYQKAITANDQLVSATIKLAQLCSTHLNDSPRALVLARRARALEPDDPVIAGTLGRLALASARSAGDFQWAFSLLQESLQQRPDDPEVRFALAMASYQLGRLDEAATAMRAVVKTGLPAARQREPETFLRMNTLAADPKLAAANAAEVEAVLKQQPEYLPALAVEAVIQEQKGNYPSARDLYEQILKLAPAFVPANKQLALLYLSHLSDPQKAYDHAVKARDAFPQDASIARALGLLNYQRADYSRATTLLTECLTRYPEDAEVLYGLGLSQFKLKQTSTSKANLTKALALSPSSPNAAEAKRLLAEIK